MFVITCVYFALRVMGIIYLKMLKTKLSFILFSISDAFMKALEKDAKERADRKNAARVEASVFKNEGNEAFKAGEFKKAVESYTKVFNYYYYYFVNAIIIYYHFYFLYYLFVGNIACCLLLAYCLF